MCGGEPKGSSNLGLVRFGVRQEKELAVRRKRDPAKPGSAERLRKEAALSLKAIAERVRLGGSKSANARPHEWMKSHPPTGAASGRQGAMNQKRTKLRFAPLSNGSLQKRICSLSPALSPLSYCAPKNTNPLENNRNYEATACCGNSAQCCPQRNPDAICQPTRMRFKVTKNE
jgi:hypothetical protein